MNVSFCPEEVALLYCAMHLCSGFFLSLVLYHVSLLASGCFVLKRDTFLPLDVPAWFNHTPCSYRLKVSLSKTLNASLLFDAVPSVCEW